VSSAFAGAMAVWPTRPGFRCLGLTLVMGAAPLVGLLWARWSGTVKLSSLDGLIRGVAAGAVGWALIDLWCPVGEISHLLLGHVLPVVILAGAGVGAARWLSRRSLPAEA
jgi:hypothetical protein